MSESRFHAATVREVEALQLAYSWKKRAEAAEAKIDAYATRADEMAAEIEALQERIVELSLQLREAGQ